MSARNPSLHTTSFSMSYEDIRVLCETLRSNDRLDYISKVKLLMRLPQQHPSVLDGLAINCYYCREAKPELFELGLASIHRLQLDMSFQYYWRLHRTRLEANLRFYQSTVSHIRTEPGPLPPYSPRAPQDPVLRTMLALTTSPPNDEPGGFQWSDAVIYFVLVDRFCKGSGAAHHQPAGPPVLPLANWQGGNWRGVIDKIEEGYFANLGVNTLWISSPVANAEHAEMGVRVDDHWYTAYHGYWPLDLDRHEERLGSEAELTDLVETAHRHGLKVLFDYVMRHVHIDSDVYREHPDWFWPNDNGNGHDCVCGDGCSWRDDCARCWFADYLPAFDFRNPKARAFSVDNAIRWIERTNADGLRLDAVKHIESTWLLDLRARITAEVEPRRSRHFYLLGETFTDDRGELTARVHESKLDGQFDFPLRAQVVRSLLLRVDSMKILADFMDENDAAYWSGAVMSTFLGNHDMQRAVHFAEDQPRMSSAWSDDRDKTWKDPPTLPKERSTFERLANAYTLLFTTRGAPLIYYGDEWGMPGVGDPDCRRFMQWDGYTDNQIFLYERISLLTRIRARHSALRRGTRTTIAAEDDTYVYRMTQDDDVVLVAINRADEPRVVDGLPEGGFDDLISGRSMTELRLELPARTAMVLVPRSAGAGLGRLHHEGRATGEPP